MSTKSSTARTLWTTIKNETIKRANTALRVGNAGIKLVDAIEERMLEADFTSASPSLDKYILGADKKKYLLNELKGVLSKNSVEYIPLVSITTEPAQWVEGEKWYNSTTKKIHTNVWLGSEQASDMEDPNGHIYKFGYLLYAFDGAALSEIGVNSQLEGVEAALDIIITALEGV